MLSGLPQNFKMQCRKQGDRDRFRRLRNVVNRERKCFIVDTYIHILTYIQTLFNHASLNNRWEADFHEGREYKINYLQEMKKLYEKR
jgi:hypothetical protein